MRALVVHDREEIVSKISALLVECGCEENDVAVADDVRSATEKLRNDMFDIAILDLTLQYKKGRGTPSYEAVENLLVEIFQTETLHIPADIIGITKEPSAVSAVSTTIGSHVLAVIEEDDGGAWKEDLRDKLSYAKRVSKARQLSRNSRFDVDLCIITALDSEMAAYNQRLTLVDCEEMQGVKRFAFTSSDGKNRRGVAFAIGRAGQSSVASAAQVLLSQYRPKLIVMSGICGGMPEKVKLGDIVLFQQVFDWDYGKWAIEKFPEAVPGVTDVEIVHEDNSITHGRRTFYARPTPLAAEHPSVTSACRSMRTSGYKFSDEEITTIKGLAPKYDLTSPQVRYGPVASGGAVIADEHMIPRIKSLNEDILAADMEAYGLYYAAKNTNVVKPMFICVKSVSDYCDSKKNDGVHEACNFISAKVALELSDKILTAKQAL
ncbi:phosphorylase family protein [Rhizobium laguerreae]|uniref:phosphorylase family protein n=1 Tax=Rhizobium laguerreae TaxID=1076926 RepID=UPI001441BD38|nr:hypothetical protein [Rhizobium laguerreae]NKM26954.1 hypothetical protein [Rhizobium laguerreae]